MLVFTGRCWPRGSLILPPGQCSLSQPLGRGVAAGIRWVEARGAAQHPTALRTAPRQRMSPERSPGLVLAQVWGQLGSACSALGLLHLQSPLACRMAVTMAVPSCCEDWMGLISALSSSPLPCLLAIL